MASCWVSSTAVASPDAPSAPARQGAVGTSSSPTRGAAAGAGVVRPRWWPGGGGRAGGRGTRHPGGGAVRTRGLVARRPRRYAVASDEGRRRPAPDVGPGGLRIRHPVGSSRSRRRCRRARRRRRPRSVAARGPWPASGEPAFRSAVVFPGIAAHSVRAGPVAGSGSHRRDARATGAEQGSSHQHRDRVDEHQRGRPSSSRTPRRRRSEPGTPPTTSRGRCAPTYDPGQADDDDEARRPRSAPRRPSHGQATAASAASVAACPETKPRPCALRRRGSPLATAARAAGRAARPLHRLGGQASVPARRPAARPPAATGGRRPPPGRTPARPGRCPAA